VWTANKPFVDSARTNSPIPYTPSHIKHQHTYHFKRAKTVVVVKHFFLYLKVLLHPTKHREMRIADACAYEPFRALGKVVARVSRRHGERGRSGRGLLCLKGAVNWTVLLRFWPDAKHVTTAAVAFATRMLQAASGGIHCSWLMHDTAMRWFVAGRFGTASQFAAGVLRAANLDGICAWNCRGWVWF
jgi:hypothetical protein